MENETKSIYTLPDYPALKKLSEALWQQDSTYHGAAILIGAGFSRSAANTGDNSKKLPLWHDLSKILHEELQEENIQDPLRLAEQYTAYYGRPALLELIKKNVNDPSWNPGDLHKSLLSLPWTEVMTTNWDTLLERATSLVHKPIYSVVSKQSDLSNARSPRVVKLHGTIGVSDELIFTQEDYRKYPTSYAAFINFVRQVFIENELCLLGFSGDDPNFLQWAGWVRDHLSGHARRIYLVGSLNLSSAKRKYLESINVSPIDLYDLVRDFDDADKRHFEAIRIFLSVIHELKGVRSWEWQPQELHYPSEHPKTNIEKARLLEQSLPTLVSDRETYPNWLVCPLNVSWHVQSQISFPYPTPEVLQEIKNGNREKIIYEMCWRAAVSGSVIDLPNAKEFLSVCDPEKLNALTKEQQVKIAFKLYSDSKWHSEEDYSYIKTSTKNILDKYGRYWSDAENEVVYNDSLLELSRFEYSIVENLSKKINTQDPVWKMRKALLLTEIGKFDDAEVLIKNAHAQLIDFYKRDRGSVFILSRLAWCERLLKHICYDNDLYLFESKDEEEMKCSTWDYTKVLSSDIRKYLEKQKKFNSIELMFEAGYYRDNSKSMTFSNELHPLLKVEHLVRSVGLPIRFKSSVLICDIIENLIQCNEVSNYDKFSLSIRTANSNDSDVLKYFFSRANVATFSANEVNVYIERCMSAIEYWLTELSSGKFYVRSKLQVFIEVLARLSIRASEEQSKDIFLLSCRLANNDEFYHVWLHEPLNHLVNYSLESISDDNKKCLLSDILLFPLAVEVDTDKYLKWPNPTINSVIERDDSESVTKRIGEIINTIKYNSASSADSLMRLLPLIRCGFLNENELNKITQKIWPKDDFATLPETGLLKFTLIELSNQKKETIKKMVSDYLYEDSNENIFSYNFLSEVLNASLSYVKLFPTKAQAIIIFEKLVSWERTTTATRIFNEYNQDDLSNIIGKVISRCIVPVLGESNLTIENFNKLHDFYKRENSHEIIHALSFFAINKEIIKDVERVITSGLQSVDSKKVSSSAFAVLNVANITRAGVTKRLVTRLVYLICSNRDCGMVNLLWTANELAKKNYIKEMDVNSLVDILPLLFDSSSYHSQQIHKVDSNTESLVRASCVKLARTLLSNSSDNHKELQRLILEAKSDALPEVRFA